MGADHTYKILLMLTVGWLFQLAPFCLNIVNIGKVTFPVTQLPNTDLLKLIGSSLILSGYCILLGVKKLREKVSEKKGARINFLYLLIIFLLTTPFVYAYFHQQDNQYFAQTILNAVLMDQDFDELPPGANPPAWAPIDGTWSTTDDGGNIVYYQDDNADKEALSISTTGNTSWTDYTYEVDVKFVDGNTKKDERGALLLFRYQGGNSYYFIYIKEYMNVVELHNHGDGAHMVKSASCDLEPDTWYHICITIIDDMVDVTMNDVSYFEDLDINGSFANGNIAIGTSYYKVMFDNIYVDAI